jgi:phospholipid/cholesterol/gamma-HCH transport system substrate-binding protein
MMTKEQKLRLFVFAVFSIILAVVLLGIFLFPKLLEKGDLYFISFRDMSVNGLYVGAPVKYQGVEIGKVTRIEVNPDDISSILVTLRVGRHFRVKTDMQATLIYMGITGQKFIELSGGSNASPNVKPPGEIPAARGLGEKAEDIVANIDTAVKSINALLDPDNRDRLSLFLGNMEKSAEVLSDVLETRKEKLANAIENLDRGSEEFNKLIANLSQVSEDLKSLTGNLKTNADLALENIARRFSEQEMGQAITRLDDFLVLATTSIKKIEGVLLAQQAELNQTFTDLAEAMANLTRFSREITEDPTLLIRTRKEKKK